ncbi:transmembrane protein 182-like [Callorhinchus milii]|uniref:Transmembrane protein 182 n=1 Tax=Callorhinchus milii TaxID=7868 RepID=K4G0J3_CALMI|nr:transmembrane protein 182-like [Callorhinchus milii]AFK11366.1 transmembrane protein [Callorhinchus milii]
MKLLRSRSICIARIFALIGVARFLLTFCTNSWLVVQIVCSHDEEDINMREIGQQFTPVGREGEPNETEDLGMKPTQMSVQLSTKIQEHLNQNRRSKRSKSRKRSRNPFPGGWSLLSMADGKIICYEGFFWNCKILTHSVEDSYVTYMLSKKPISKSCVEAFHTPFPLNLNLSNHAYASKIGYRHAWSAMMIIAVLIIGIGFALITYEGFTGKDTLHRMGGRFFFLAGILLICSIIIYIIWIQSLTDLQSKIAASMNVCSHSVNVNTQYGWSFLITPFAIVSSLIAGYLFHHI